MHELAITENILEIALRHGSNAGAQRITDLHLVIGELCSIVDDCVQFYWEVLSQSTIADGSRLHFRREPVEMRCLACNRRYLPTREGFSCPFCGGEKVRVIGGEAFYLDSIEIELPDASDTGAARLS